MLSEAYDKTVVNLGSGRRGSRRIPHHFTNWREFRVDADPNVQPDLIANVTDLSSIQENSVDAVWMSHCIEHLYQHDVAKSIREIMRILKFDGFACITTPDLQSVANFIVEDRLNEVVYQSAAGPVTAHDMLFGFGPDIASGRVHMAHRCGFTPASFADAFRAGGFEHFLIRRRPSLELAAILVKSPWKSQRDREELMLSLEL